jgi:hypothetical protein
MTPGNWVYGCATLLLAGGGAWLCRRTWPTAGRVDRALWLVLLIGVWPPVVAYGFGAELPAALWVAIGVYFLALLGWTGYDTWRVGRRVKAQLAQLQAQLDDNNGPD